MARVRLFVVDNFSIAYNLGRRFVCNFLLESRKLKSKKICLSTTMKLLLLCILVNHLFVYQKIEVVVEDVEVEDDTFFQSSEDTVGTA